MEIYIYTYNLKDASFEDFYDYIVHDGELIETLDEYLAERDVEVFERRGNVAATEAGWICTFHTEDETEDRSVWPEDKNAPRI